MRTVVVGCGYVGLELGRQLRQRGHEVVGVRRSDAGLDAVEEAGLEAVRADATDADSLAAVPDVDWLVYAASAGRGGDFRETYVDGLATTVDALAARESPPARLVYASSTGVYGDRGGGWVDEETPLEPSTARQRALVDAEEVALSAPFDATVARFGGIYGPGRTRVERYLERPVPEGNLNLVHRDDAAGAVAFLLDGESACDADGGHARDADGGHARDADGGLARDEVVLAVDDEPVWKPDLAAWLADRVGTDPPPTRTRSDVRADDSLSPARRERLLADKRCSNAKLRGLGYEFAYPTFREGYADAVRRYLDENG